MDIASRSFRGLFISIAIMVVSPALAENINLTDALASHTELSEFAEALVATDVIKELNPKTSYSIFAPTNEYLDKVVKGEPSCLDSEWCKAEMTVILRNHIVAGAINLQEIAKQKTKVLSSINGHTITIVALPTGNFTADGNAITMQQAIPGGVMLYEINGLLANPQEHSDMQSIHLE